MSTPVQDRGAYAVLTAPIIVLVGHFGSGKSEIALNLAFGLRERGRDVSLIDLDVVKPYFRCRVARQELEARGIALIVPGGEHFYADLPIIVPEVRGALSRTDNPNASLIVDAGGHDMGARALGAMADLVDPSRLELLFVVNTRRPFAEDQGGLATMLHDIERTAGLRVTGLVANTHLMEETTPEIVREGLAATRALSSSTGIPVRFHAALRRLAVDTEDWPLLPIDRRVLPPEQRRRPTAAPDGKGDEPCPA